MTKAIEILDLRKTYDNGHVALKGVSLSVEKGDFFALLGPNGAGKSTLLGVLSSLVNKSSGSVRIMGHDLDTELVAAKSCLGVVPQEFNFNQFEKVEDILIAQAGYYGIEAVTARARAAKYMQALGLWDKRNQQSRNLSGGMKRRLMIARALIHEPRILLLDEPTAGVDIELRRSMWTFLKEINAAGTTIILTTHYLEEAEALCRNIAIIDQGQILENTSKHKLLGKLSLETYVLETLQPLDVVPNLEKFPCRLADDGCLEVDVDKDLTVTLLLQELTRQGIEVKSIRTKSNRLEELFIRLVDASADKRG